VGLWTIDPWRKLSDPMSCLEAISCKLYHLGIGTAAAIRTISKVKETLPHKMYERIAYQLILEAKQIYIDKSENDIWL
jgi:hypothetical protein